MIAVKSMYLSLMQEVGQDENYKEVVKKYRARHLYELKKINRAYRITYSPEDLVYKEGQPNGVHIKVDENGQVTEYISVNGESIQLFKKLLCNVQMMGRLRNRKFQLLKL